MTEKEINGRFLYATLDAIVRIDSTHFSLEFYKYSKMDLMIKKLEKLLGRTLRVQFSEYEKEPRKRIQELSRKHAKPLIEPPTPQPKEKKSSAPFWDVPDLLEE